MKANDIIAKGTDYDLRVYHDGTSWQAYGYFKDSEIDSVWCEVSTETFEEMDGMILDIICDELA